MSSRLGVGGVKNWSQARVVPKAWYQADGLPGKRWDEEEDKLESPSPSS